MSEPKIRITWNVHWACNHRCSYCFFDSHWTEYAKRNVHKSVAEWMDCWKRVHERYGRAAIAVTGGEPFLYPGFSDIIRRLSEIHWPINISTNASLDLPEFAEAVDPERVSLSVSFHPQYRTISEFVATVRMLRDRKVDLGCLNFVAYPPFLKDLPGFVEEIRAIGESLKVIPFVGTYRGVEYPGGYDPEQKRLLGMSGTDEGWVDSKRRKGSLCPAGHRSALLLPDGRLTRCGQIGDRGIFADFFDKEFSFLESPKPCDADLCPCDEWKVISDEKPPERAGAWLP